ncbi:hypothetical protein [Microvirga sp. KLBC 81]|uniref:hypothetical protein n=1 Tax=Microvirga sp. KLBC 81 TaxID=1862707 RepID=UPI001057AEFB|nr:hypothetical protein [Microvirga sp. KLBC 81]
MSIDHLAKERLARDSAAVRLTAAELTRGITLYCLAIIISLVCSSVAHADGVVVRKTDARVPDSGSFPPYSGTWDLNSGVAKCPSGQYITAIQGFKYQVRALVALRYMCADQNGNTSIHKTEAAMPDHGRWRRYSGTLGFSEANAGTVVCPGGSFVSRIEVMKNSPDSPLGGVIFDVRYLCTRDGDAPEIRKTNFEVPDTGGPAHPRDLAIATCPSGTFVNAIQGFKWEGTTVSPLVQLRFTCQ